MTSNVITGGKKSQFVETLAPQPRTRAEFNRRARLLASSDASIAVAWLNITMRTPGYKRVLRLRAHLEYLTTLHPSEPKFRLIFNIVNGLLSRYEFVPALACDVSTGVVRYNALPKETRGRAVEVSDGRLTVQVNEAAVGAAFARLFASRELFKVRLCERCRKVWRVSERRMDRFCSDECRQAFYKGTPEYLERQRNAQQRYRQRLREHIAAQGQTKKGKK